MPDHLPEWLSPSARERKRRENQRRWWKRNEPWWKEKRTYWAERRDMNAREQQMGAVLDAITGVGTRLDARKRNTDGKVEE